MAQLQQNGAALSAQDKIDVRTGLDLGSAALLNAPTSGNATSGEAVKGDDTRLSNARTPTAHAHVISDVTGLQTALNSAVPLAQKGAADGVATLDGAGKLPQSQLPAIALVEYLGAAANQVAMLALTGQAGDWCTRTDLGTNWIITGSTPSQLSSWTALSYPASPVTSVAGRTGAVVLSAADVSGLGSSATTPASAYATAAQGAKADTAAQIAGDLSGTAATPVVSKINGVAVTGTPTSGQVPVATSGTAASWQTPSGGGLPTGVTSPGDGALDYSTGTLVASRPSVNVSQTWNNAAVPFSADVVNITDTASAAASTLLDRRVGGVSRFSVNKNGGISVPYNPSFRPYSSTSGANGFQLYSGGPGVQIERGDSAHVAQFFSSDPACFLVNGVGFGPVGGSRQVTATYDGANIWAQRNGTAAQESRVYGTFTDTSNYRRLSRGMSASGAGFLRSEGLGTGASGNQLYLGALRI